MQLDEVKAIGGVFTYPDALTAYQWACLRSLERARQKDQDRERIEQERKSQQSVLENRMRGRIGG